MKKRKRIVIPLIMMLMLVNTVLASASTNVPYDTYNYDYWGNVVYTPAAYIPSGKLTGDDLEIGSFSSPQDFFITDTNIYIVDTGGNRIIALNHKLQLTGSITDFSNNGAPDKFKEPRGICVTDNGNMYIADSGNKRIVVLDSKGVFIKTISDPKSEVLPKDFSFVPLEVSVDYAGRVYVIAQNMFQGIMAFDEFGNFTGFTGTINVSISPYEIFWRKILSREQIDRGKLFVPTEFTGMDIDKDGFLYATNVDNKGDKSVRLINPKGQDVITKGDDSLGGDMDWWGAGQYSGPSRIEDIVERDKGIYTVLDSMRGRIFTYDKEGNLLYIFGGLGKQNGTLKTPTAIEALGDKILVLDAGRNAILFYEPTEYGRLISEAVGLRFDGDEAKAVEKWKEVLKLDSNFELAYVGIGKSYLTAGDNVTAMKYLELGRDKEFYSIAFKRHRNQILGNNLEYVLTIGVLLVVVLPITSKIIKMRKRRKTNV